jgi:hypothetical protein
MAIADPDRRGAVLAELVTKPEAVPTAALSFPRRETGRAAKVAIPGLGVRGQRPTKVDRGFLEDLSGDLVSPSEPGNLLGDSAV